MQVTVVEPVSKGARLACVMFLFSLEDVVDQILDSRNHSAIAYCVTGTVEP